jgi:hypothetical protein
MHTRMRGSSPTQRVRSSVRGAGDSLPCRRGHWPSLRTDLWRRFSTEAMLSLANDSICKQVPFTGAQHWRFSFAGRAWNAYKRTRLNFMTQLFFVCKELVCSAWGSSGRVRRPGSLAQLCFFSLLFEKRCHMRAALKHGAVPGCPARRKCAHVVNTFAAGRSMPNVTQNGWLEGGWGELVRWQRPREKVSFSLFLSAPLLLSFPSSSSSFRFWHAAETAITAVLGTKH